MDKKFQSRLLHSKAMKEGFQIAKLKWHRWTCYLNWAILIGDRLGKLFLPANRSGREKSINAPFNFTYGKGLYLWKINSQDIDA